MSEQNKPLVRGFHHLAIRSRCFEKSVRFYNEGLGFPIVRAWGEGKGRIVLLDAGNGNYVEIFANGEGTPPAEGLIWHFAFRADDCDAAMARALAAGAEVYREAKSLTIASEPPLPVRLAFVKGPDGELVEFFQNDQT